MTTLRGYVTFGSKKRGLIWEFYYRETNELEVNLHATIHYVSFADSKTIFML